MKTTVPFFLAILLLTGPARSQITSPVIRANFGVDADLKANYFYATALAGSDDWFKQSESGIGDFVIDTTGAASILSQYNASVANRRTSISRSMRYPIFSLMNNKLLMDAVFVRDFHGDDSTVFASGSNKNGDNPADWQCPTSQGIPDKNDILDMMIHVRRAGPNVYDSLWMFGGMSLDNTQGNRYFDFEMYQTNLVYNRASLNFSGQGPDAGHTSWLFDASGNVIQAGDIIFSAEYQSSSLTNIEARIWVNESALLITPAAFEWGGQFDGASAGATYGYASIQPKAAGTYYTGLQCGNNTWGGPFQIVLQNDNLATDYQAKQFVEFSVNLTKLGLDPMTTLGGNACSLPFRRVLVKTRASASFTAELKDFVAPFAFFNPSAPDVATASPSICNSGSLAEIHVTSPLTTSTYTWSTPNGSFYAGNTGPSVYVDTPGTYIVTQYLYSGCSAFASDTIVVQLSNSCVVLPLQLRDLNARVLADQINLSWTLLNNQQLDHLIVERSADGVHFTAIGALNALNPDNNVQSYSFVDPSDGISNRNFYRIRMINHEQGNLVSSIVSVQLKHTNTARAGFFPNPARDHVQLRLVADQTRPVRILLYDPTGRKMAERKLTVQPGTNIFTLEELEGRPRGIYLATLLIGDLILQEKIILAN